MRTISRFLSHSVSYPHPPTSHSTLSLSLLLLYITWPTCSLVRSFVRSFIQTHTNTLFVFCTLSNKIQVFAFLFVLFFPPFRGGFSLFYSLIFLFTGSQLKQNFKVKCAVVVFVAVVVYIGRVEWMHEIYVQRRPNSIK